MVWNGLLLIDKPADCTSHDVVDRVRALLGQSAVGHAGTLDPLATGLLVLLLGQATKLSDFIMAHDKSYVVTVKLGVTTDSGDRDGATIQTVSVNLTEYQISQAAWALRGELELPVPMFSATRLKGKKLYEYARRDQVIEVPKKRMTFHEVNLIEFSGDTLVVQLKCSKGAYVRSWVTALGDRLGVGATVMELRRLNSAPYRVQDAVTLEQLAEAIGAPDATFRLGRAFVPMSQALPGFALFSVRGREEQLLRHGQISHDLANRMVVIEKAAIAERRAKGIRVVGAAGDLVGVLEALPMQGLKIRRIFHN